MVKYIGHVVVAVWLVILCVSHSQNAWAIDPIIEKQLLDKSVFWGKRGDTYKSKKALKKLLFLDPNNSKALRRLGQIALQEGQKETALKYLDMLKSTHPNDRGVRRLKNKINGIERKSILEKARTAAARGAFLDAVHYYQAYFKKHTLKDNLALEYYRTAAAIPSYWDFSRQGYERLVKKNPTNATYAFALAQHLTYRKQTRVQGIQQLAMMSHDKKNKTRILKAWRKALIWLPIEPVSIDAYERYLKRVGSDRKVSSLIQQVTEGTVETQVDIQKRKAFNELNNGSVEKASSLFSSLLQKHKKDADINGGMGVALLKMKRFSEAESFLHQAIQLNPLSEKRWRDAYRSAKYWHNISSSKQDIKQQRFGLAETKIKQAIRIQPKEIQGYLALAQLQRQRGDEANAIKTLEKGLALAPRNYALRLALTQLHVKQHAPQATEEALSLLENYPSESGNSQLFMQAYTQDKSKGFKHRELTQRAKLALEQHVIANPEDTWARMDLATMYRQLKQRNKALSLLKGVMRNHPRMIEPRYMAAQIYMENKQWDDAELLLKGLSVADMPKNIRDLQQTIRMKKNIKKALILKNMNRKPEAIALLEGIDQYKNTMSIDNLTALANAWAELGMPYRSLAIGRRIIHMDPKHSYDAKLSYVSILIATHENAEADIWLMNLMRNRKNLNPKQQKTLMGLAQGQAVQHSDQARLGARFSQAWDYLAPYLQQKSPDTDILLAEARIYHDAKRDREALAVYETLFRRDPKNPDILEAATYSALAIKNFRMAGNLIKKGIQLEPKKPRFYMLLAQLEQAQGHDREALKALTKAKALKNLESDSYRVQPRQANPSGQPKLRNPFLNVSKVDIQPYQPSPPRMLTSTAYAALPIQPIAPSHRFELSMDPVLGKRESYAALPLRPIEAPTLKYMPDRVPLLTKRSDDPASELLLATTTMPPTDVFQLRPHSNIPRLLPRATKESADNPFIYAKTPDMPRVLASGQAPSTALDFQIENIKSKLSTVVSVGIDIHDRKGEGGLSLFNTVELPVEIKSHPFGHRLTLRMVPVLLSAGSLDMSNLNRSNRFGSNSLVGVKKAQQLPQRAQGVALHVAYAWNALQIDMGVSPVGLPINNFIGGISFHPKIDDQLAVGIGVNRRSITDTLLSYAGAFDPVTKAFWGGVVKNSLDASFDLTLPGGLGLYGKASFGRLTGQNTAANNTASISTGGFYPLFQEDNTVFRAGLNLSLETYTKNLGYYTLGHGGYFSPQRYITLAVPMTLKGSEGALSYNVGGYLGWQTFQEDSVAYFPNHPIFQARSGKIYPSRNTASFFMGIEASAEYVLASQWSLGAHIGFDNAQNYKLLAISTYLHYRFDGFTDLPKFSLEPLQGFYEKSL